MSRAGNGGWSSYWFVTGVRSIMDDQIVLFMDDYLGDPTRDCLRYTDRP